MIEFTRYVSPDVTWLKRANTCCGEAAFEAESESEYPLVVPWIAFDTRSVVVACPGRTHAAMVSAVVRSRLGASGTVT